MEIMSEKFDYSLIERLIKHCPKNLKIVVSSDSFINFDYNKFEPHYPILIDENILGEKPYKPNFDTYIKDFNTKQKLFLTYISSLDYVDKDFVNEFYPDGNEVLARLSCQECYVATRDIKTFRLNTLFRNWLKKEQTNYKEEFESFMEINSIKRFGNFLLKNKRYYEAFKIFNKSSNLEGIEKSLKGIIENKNDINNLKNYCRYNNNTVFGCVKDYPYYRWYLSLNLYVQGDYNVCYITAKDLTEEYRGKNNKIFIHSFELMIKCHLKRNRFNDANELIKEIKSSNDIFNIDDFEEIFSFIPLISRELDIPINFSEINIYEEALDKKESKDKIWYAKIMQAIAEAYFDTGNYQKAMGLTKQIKKVIPYYVIPHNLIMFYYFSGNIDVASNIAKESLEFALKHEITKDVSLLYTALANIDLYYGRAKDALKKFDIAISIDKENDYTKFYNISQRCMAYARYGELNYAKEVSHIYLKYCETFSPYYANMMLCALAYCYAKLGNNEQSYFYATKCIKESKSRSIFWLCGMAIATSYLLQRGNLKDANSLIKNILKSSYIYGMEIMLVDKIDIFEPLLIYARNNGIEIDYVNKIYIMIKKKEKQKHTSYNLQVKLFGMTNIYFEDKEIQWKTKKAKELFLHYILADNDGIDRNMIIEYLWKDYVYESAINNLKTTNNIIRKTLKQYDIDFNLNYVNSKYVLKIDNLTNDYNDFMELLERYKEENNIITKKKTMNELIEINRKGFAIEIKNIDFDKHRNYINYEMTIILLKLVKELINSNDFIDAKRYLNYLLQIDKNEDYNRLSEEIASHLN